MKIYNLTSRLYLDHVIEDGTVEMVDTYNTNVTLPAGMANPRFVSGAWVDVPTSEKVAQEIAERAMVQARVNALQYLADTDWYVSRKAETDKAIPSEILTKRAQARIDASDSGSG